MIGRVVSRFSSSIAATTAMLLAVAGPSPVGSTEVTRSGASDRVVSPGSVRPPIGTPVGSRPDIGADYFQQGVSYRIDAELDTETHVISASQELIYLNASPDTLDAVTFHLYQNAFRTGSHHDFRLRSEGDFALADLPEAKWGGTEVHDLRDGLDRPLRHTLDDTILDVWLNEPLLPGGHAVFRMGFETRFGDYDRRMKRGDDFYIGAHWYPRIAVYDWVRGWNRDQHLGREFYGDFGSFTWSLSLPAHYIVEGSGVLWNREEVLPPDLAERLDIRRFADKPWNEPASVVIEPTTETKTWRFHAADVHDVAWIASPSFRIGVAQWDGVRVLSVAREQHASRWQDAAETGRLFIEDFSERWGRYPWPKIIVADVESGMEYPMLTADDGESPTYRGLFGHEIAHNWFYGFIGSNETYRAFLDEGFSNFITAETMDAAWGEGSATPWRDRYRRWFFPKLTRKYFRNDLRYLRFTRAGFERDPIATHSDAFREYQNYRLVYSKGATMLWNLEYVLGDVVFRDVMRTYVARFTFQHPYPEDFQRVAEEVSGHDLDGFFTPWLDTTKQVDYAVRSVQSRSVDGETVGHVVLERKGDLAMPLDLEVLLENGGRRRVHVPVTDTPMKPLGASWFVTPAWYGWDRLRRRFEFDVPVSAPIREVRIDPSGRLADVDRRDNTSRRLPRVDLHVDNLVLYYPSLDAHDIYLRPSFLWNAVDGVNIGAHWFSGYLLTEFTRQSHTRGAIWWGTRSSNVSYDVFAETPARSFGPLTHVFGRAANREGRVLVELGVDVPLRKRLYETPSHRFTLSATHHQLVDGSYVRAQDAWTRGRIQMLTLRHAHETGPRRPAHESVVRIDASAFDSDRSFWRASATRRGRLPGTAVRYRLRAELEEGAVPAQLSGRLAQASAYDAWRDQWSQATRGTAPASFDRDARMHYAGGPNLRGFVGSTYAFDRAVSASLEVPFGILERAVNRPIFSRVRMPFRVYAFGDGGLFRDRRGRRLRAADDLFPTRQTEDRLFADAGVGVSMALAWIPASLGTYHVRIDVPIVTYDGLREDTDTGLERWIVGIGDAF